MNKMSYAALADVCCLRMLKAAVKSKMRQRRNDIIAKLSDYVRSQCHAFALLKSRIVNVTTALMCISAAVAVAAAEAARSHHGTVSSTDSQIGRPSTTRLVFLVKSYSTIV